MDKLEQLGKIISESDNIVFFGGAGVSTESGIKDFRSADGLYNQHYKYPPETILSHTFFMNHPEEYYEFHHAKLTLRGVKPNTAHYKLAELEKQGKLKAVITQNIDGLHQMAGSVNVLELHGSTARNYCIRCGKKFPANYVDDSPGVPRCECGGIVRPDVVLYEESLDGEVLEKSVEFISRADVLIVGGTSLNVYPAAGLINYYRGDKLVLINRDSTPYDGRANLIINDSIGKVLGAVC